ncbi:hypothetical protein RN616_19935 (plasmid) [Morganella morganii]|uniref:hypothetical protein n=1 Tax=Morganella morganii TaxID=582 RepID=UPI000D9FE3D0|nr:hypothetical protein [Morganella morganii]WNP32588.1 hypothetical protein RN616_19935 [Morganella morganii]SPX81862.1 Uncharacterised protein [Morganella morganii]
MKRLCKKNTEDYLTDAITAEAICMLNYRDTCRSIVKEITLDEYYKMLRVRPPKDKQGNGYNETFKLLEKQFGYITGIYIKIGRRYFHFYDNHSLSHSDIILKVIKSDAWIKKR